MLEGRTEANVKGIVKAVMIMSALLMTAGPASAQQHSQAFWDRLQPGAAVDGRPGCTWQWARDTVGPWGGWYHACATPQPARAQQELPEAPATAGPPAQPCGAYNPYSDPAGMMACIAALPAPPPAPLPAIHAGQRYYLGYPSLQVQVLSIAVGLDGLQ